MAPSWFVQAIRSCWSRLARIPSQRPARVSSRFTVDYREYTYAAGKIPGRLYQARRPSHRERNSHQPADRPARSARCFPKAFSMRPRSSAWCSPPIPNRTPTPWPSIGAGRRAGHLRHSVPPRSRRLCASAWSTASCVANPSYDAEPRSLQAQDRRRRHRRPAS